MAFKNLKKHFIRFLKYPPGDRFVHYFQMINRRIKENVGVKMVLLAISAILFLIGFVLLFIPGPGIPFILLSIIFFCLVSKKIAVFFDRLEVKIRMWVKRKG